MTGPNHADEAALDDEAFLERMMQSWPGPVQRAYAWLRRPGAKWVRWPAGVLLMLGGVFSFLPILGIWMLPLGALLLGDDIPPLRRVTIRGLRRVHSWWRRWRG